MLNLKSLRLSRCYCEVARIRALLVVFRKRLPLYVMQLFPEFFGLIPCYQEHISGLLFKQYSEFWMLDYCLNRLLMQNGKGAEEEEKEN